MNFVKNTSHAKEEIAAAEERLAECAKDLGMAARTGDAEFYARCERSLRAAMEELDQARALKSVDFDGVRALLRSLWRNRWLTWVERNRVRRWLEDGIYAGTAKTDLREMETLYFFHL